MKNNFLLNLGKILVVIFVFCSIVDGILYYSKGNQVFCLKIIEILSAFSASISLSISINQKNTNKLDNSSNNQIVQQNGNGKFYFDNSIKNDPEVVIKSVKECLIPYMQDNIESVCKKIFVELSKENLDKPLDKDFLIKYLSESSIISNQDIQDILVKLLLMENNSKGSVSKRTLDIVKNMSSSEAHLFERVAALSLKDGTIYEGLIEKIPFMEISKLQDIGLLKSNDFIQQTITMCACDSIDFIEDGLIITVKNNNKNNKVIIQYSCNLLTSEGIELKNALGIIMKQTTFLEFGRMLISKFSNNQNLEFTTLEIKHDQDKQFKNIETDM